ncbi:hypothetical protein PtrM4_005290 [Pyrenophora tritici-repentis]|uniref:Uncharacterized protein n=1 Tax=Pyrenophora tritici-repentis TaxID=45151 RepID=A0A834S5X8_9PLEO|nr:hypothetical protein PtrM4_005290 [Pyrenophora tritici-repentis]
MTSSLVSVLCATPATCCRGRNWGGGSAGDHGFDEKVGPNIMFGATESKWISWFDVA